MFRGLKKEVEKFHLLESINNEIKSLTLKYKNMNQMEGINYVTNDEDKRVAVMIDLNKHGSLWEDFLDVIESEAVKDEETITLEELKTELKAEGKL